MLRVLAIFFAAFSAFFFFYTARLLVVTGFMQQVKTGGNGAYIGAVAFPFIAVACGIIARSLWRRANRRPADSHSGVAQ